MYRTRLAVASVVALGLIAPVTGATSASAIPTAPPTPVACADNALHKDFKHIKAAALQAAKGKSIGHSRFVFADAGKVTSIDTSAGTLTFVVRGGQVKALRGCDLTVTVPKTAKVMRNKANSTLGDIVAGDRVNVKGVIARNATTHAISFTATRVVATATTKS